MPNLFKKKINKAVLVAVVLAVAGVLYLLFSQGVLTNFFSLFSKTEGIQKEQPAQGAKIQSFDYEPGPVTILQGTIQEIASDFLVVKAQENEQNPALQSRAFKVAVSAGTEFFLLDKPFYFSKSKEETKVLSLPMPSEKNICQENCWQKIEFSSLQKGDLVVVVGNIGERDAFLSKEIYKGKFLNYAETL